MAESDGHNTNHQLINPIMHPNQWTRKVGTQLAADKKNKSLYGGIALPGSKRSAKADHVACKKHRAWHCSPRKFTVKASSLDWL